jgi:hypothetical protein
MYMLLGFSSKKPRIFVYGAIHPLIFTPLFFVPLLGVGIEYGTPKDNLEDEAIKNAVEKVRVTILGLGVILPTRLYPCSLQE